MEQSVAFSDNQAYFQAYFDICRIYRLKRRVLKKLYSRRSQSECLRTEQCTRRLGILNTTIQKQEQEFWRKAAAGKEQGCAYAFESLAETYSLDLFEKRMLLFFLYLEYIAIEKNICLGDELVHLLDMEESCVSRMRNFNYLTSSASLFRHGLLDRDFRRETSSERCAITISTRALGLLADMLNGNTIKPSAPEEESVGQAIGCVKKPEYTFAEIHVKDEVKDKIRMFLDMHKDDTFTQLGITERIKKGLGTAFLFHGAPGTGKSILAEAIAAYLGKKLLIVEYPKIMERWVGETDKNIAMIFGSAAQEDLVVVLDEADTLFYNRTFAREEHDIRFVNEMLQELERFRGVIILTTNMEVLLDPALERRLALKVRIEPPSKELRFKIWQSHIPQTLRQAEGIDYQALAATYEFTGGNIKNAVLNAFRKMASRKSDVLTYEDLMFGADLEKEGMFSAPAKRRIVGFCGKQEEGYAQEIVMQASVAGNTPAH